MSDAETFTSITLTLGNSSIQHWFCYHLIVTVANWLVDERLGNSSICMRIVVHPSGIYGLVLGVEELNSRHICSTRSENTRRAAYRASCIEAMRSNAVRAVCLGVVLLCISLLFWLSRGTEYRWLHAQLNSGANLKQIHDRWYSDRYSDRW